MTIAELQELARDDERSEIRFACGSAARMAPDAEIPDAQPVIDAGMSLEATKATLFDIAIARADAQCIHRADDPPRPRACQTSGARRRAYAGRGRFQPLSTRAHSVTIARSRTA